MMASQEMQLPVPADGVIPFNIFVMNETETLTIDVSNQTDCFYTF